MIRRHPFYVFASVALLSTALHAELRPCYAPGAGLKVFADDLHATGQARSFPQADDLIGGLSFVINGKVETLRVDWTDLGLTVVPCPDRVPLSIAEFDEDFVKELYRDGIVLEVWGLLTSQADDRGSIEPLAQISYLIIPLRRRAGPDSLPPPLHGHYQVTYRPDASQDDLIEVLEQAREIEAYAALSVGLKRLHRQQNDQAVPALCAAHYFLERAGQDPRLAADPSFTPLLDYVAEQGQVALDNARSAGNTIYNDLVPGDFSEVCARIGG